MSWTVYAVYMLFTGGVRWGGPHAFTLPDWVQMLYNISHSIFVSCTAVLVAYLILKRLPVSMLAWPLAVIMDTPTHSREFFPTPFLWPFSDWHFPGISWGQGWFVILNWTLIICCMVLIKKKLGSWKDK